MWLFWKKLITFSPPHTRERARRCLSLEFKECVQPGVTVCRVSVWGWPPPPPLTPSLLLFLMGILDKLREPLFQTQPKENEGKFPCVPWTQWAQRLSGKITCWPQEVIRICSLPSYRLHLYGGRHALQVQRSHYISCWPHVIARPVLFTLQCYRGLVCVHKRWRINGSLRQFTFLLFVRCQVRWLRASNHGNPG